MTSRIIAFMVLLLTAGLVAQQPRPAQPPTVPRTNTLPPIEQDKSDAPMTSPAKMLKYQHEEVKKDMDKLVKLVGEVQEEVDKAGENVLPLNTLKKLDEVERLTKKVRSRIKQ